MYLLLLHQSSLLLLLEGCFLSNVSKRPTAYNSIANDAQQWMLQPDAVILQFQPQEVIF